MKSTVRTGFQKSILPRLLSGQANRVQEIGVQPLRLIGPFNMACPQLCIFLQDRNLQTAKALRYYHSTVHKEDILYFKDGSAGVVQSILGNEVNVYFVLKSLPAFARCELGNRMAVDGNRMGVPIYVQRMDSSSLVALA